MGSPAPPIERAARAAAVAVVADALGDLVEGAGDVALEVAEMGVDRGRELGVADLASGLVLGGVIDQGGEVQLHAIDQRLATNGPGREVLRVRVERDRAGLAGGERHDEVGVRLGEVGAGDASFEGLGRRGRGIDHVVRLASRIQEGEYDN